MQKTTSTALKEKAILVGVLDGNLRFRNSEMLDELENLAETAGAIVIDKVVQKRDAVSPKYYIGAGKVDELADLVQERDIDIVIFDNDLTPAQIRNMELALGTKVIDRTELILDIFATHARTHQAKLQVELAQLEYTMPRLRRMWTHLSRQEGSLGIAQRGPGEKQIEVDRRLARNRIAALHKEISQLERRKQREISKRSENYTISLVGYTNAGKSTLMKTLTGADVYIDDKLFSTLDTRTRVWKFRSGFKVLLSDTVGFIKALPHNLIASFHATLEEVSSADLLLHIVDASHPNVLEQIQSVHSVLAELGCNTKQMLLVLNKIDKMTDRVTLTMIENRFPEAIPISALATTNLDKLEHRIEGIISERLYELDIQLPFAEGKLLSELSEQGRILKKEFTNDHALLKIRIPRKDLYKFENYRNGVKI
ncbi:GTPase HflX [Candidatus Peregrinibacteria bacterium]|nr:GTPase HflX [Candidatus Peregrinibacteria bacterium]